MSIDWKKLYYIFDRLWNEYTKLHENPEIGRQILNGAMNPRYSFESLVKEINGFGLKRNFDHDWNDFLKLRQAHDILRNTGYSKKTPAESVYQTAIQIKKLRLDEAIDREGSQRWFFRGQRKAEWSVTPSIFRGLNNLSQKNKEKEFLNRVLKVRKAVFDLSEDGIGLEEFRTLSIVQHYSNELDLKTWLLDVTLSPYIALFFASDGAENNDVGVLHYIERTEWLLFSEGDLKNVGTIRYTSPKGIPRIENQMAFFIESPHPELYRQMSHRRLYFQQAKDVVFENSSINKDKIYPKSDLILKKIKRLEKGDLSSIRNLKWEPSLKSIEYPDFSIFLNLVEPWLAEANITDTKLVEKFCKLHAELTRQQNLLPHYISTLHHLRRVIAMLKPSKVSNENLVKNIFMLQYVSHVKKSKTIDIFKKCVTVSCPNWGPVINSLLK